MPDGPGTGRKATAPRRRRALVPAVLDLEPRALLTHFRSASLSWEAVAGLADTVEFHLRFAARRDSSSAGAAVRVGDVVTDTTAMDRLEFGDGNVHDPVWFRVLDVSADAFVAEAVRPDDALGFVPGIRHTYAGDGPFTARYRGNNRIGPLRNEAMRPYQVTARVDLATAGSGPSAAPGTMVVVADDAVARFPVPAFDPDGDAVRVRLATPAEASYLPGYAPPPGLAVGPDGLVTWDLRDAVRDTSPGDLWTVQFVVEELDRGGNVRGTGSVDVLLAVAEGVSAAPEFRQVPASPVILTAGQPVALELEAFDPDGSAPVTLRVLNPPPGLAVVPRAPAPGAPASTSASRLEWTPTASQASRPYDLVVLARDADGRAASRTIRLGPRNLPPVARANGPYGAAGATVVLSAAGSADPDGAIVRYEWDLDDDGTRFDVDARGATPTVSAAAFRGPLDRTIALRVTDDRGASAVATARMRLNPGVEGGLDPATDTGASASDRVTGNPQPRLVGRAYPGATVRVYAQPIGTSDLIELGTTDARADGAWSVLARAGALRDGGYGLVATVSDPASGRGGTGWLGPLLVDTAGPRVVGVTVRPATGEVVVALADDRTGLDAARLADPASYRLVHPRRPNVPLAVTQVTLGPAGAGNATRTVTVQFDGGRALRPGPAYLLTVFSGGLADVAGNALDGEARAGFPSGNGQPGGHFATRIVPPVATRSASARTVRRPR
jgi:hypothetical protein